MVLASLITSCTDNDTVHDSTLESDSSDFVLKSSQNLFVFTPEDSLEVVSNANKDMRSFVNSLRENHEVGDTYHDFKTKLDLDNSLADMHPAANDLLSAAYEHLNSNANDATLTGMELLNVMLVIIDLAENDGYEHYNELTVDVINDYAITLWGSDVESLSKRSCKWCQIGCHISNAWDWLGSPSNGGGGQTNGQVLASVAATVASTLATIAAFIALGD